MLFQLSAATVVPVIHPLLHLVPHTDVVVTSAPDVDDHLEARLDGSCFACHVSPASMGSPPTLLERSSIHGRLTIPRPVERQVPVHRFAPANPVRAPPTL